MKGLLDIIDRGDLCSLTGVIVVLVWLGSVFAGERQKKWGGILAVLSFLAYGAYALERFRPGSAEELFGISLRALVTAGLILGLSWLVLPFVAGVVGWVWQKLRSSTASHRAWWDRVAQEQRERERRRREEEAWRRSAPQRERDQKEVDANAKSGAQARKRREDAVAAAEVTFALHQHELGERFTSQMFQHFLTKYMGDDRDPQYVEERSRQLQDVITQLVAKGSRPELPSTLADLELWFQNQKRTIEQSGLDDTEKKIKLLHLQKRYDDLFTRLIHGA